MQHQMTKEYKPENGIVTFLSWTYFKVSFLPPAIFRWLMRFFITCGFSPIGWRKVGPYQIGLDANEKFQRFMLVDQYEQQINSIISDVLQPGDVYIDIGTQLGFTAAIAAESIGTSGRMVLFEPDPRALSRLKVHLETSDPEDSPEVKLFEAACSSQKGTLNFEISDTLGQSRIVTSNENNGDKIIQVPIVVADEELEELGIDKIHFLKIDAEGHELDVLRGLQKFLSSQNIMMLMVENNVHSVCNFGIESEFVHALISRHGYYGVHESSLKQVTKDSLKAGDVELENLFYVHDPELLNKITNEKIVETSPGYTTNEIEDLYQIAIDPEHPVYQAQEIIAIAETGKTNEAIKLAENLLIVHPDQYWLRGHLAFWLLSIGERQKSIEHYQFLVKKNPENQNYREILAGLET